MQLYKQYKWLMPSLIFNVSVLLIRVLYSGSLTYLFLLWNLFLAMLPLYFALKIDTSVNKWIQVCYASVWLLFFPNSMYIITDLFHLAPRADVPLWYDLLLLLSTGINGVVLGFLSLRIVEKWLSTITRREFVSKIVFGLLLLCGYGIYLGRYLRWNSWDVICSPVELFTDIGYDIRHPFRNIDVWLLTALFGTWMYLMYNYTKKLREIKL